MNRWVKTGTLSLSLALGVLAAGCSGSVVAEGPAVAADGVATKAPLTTLTHGHVKLAADALGQVPLRSDQRAQVEALAAQADAQHTAVHAARQALMLAIADQIAAGQVDKNALQPKLDAIGAAALAAQTSERAGLEKLHAVLDSSQRSLFVDTLQANMQARWQAHDSAKGGGWRGGAGGMKARWAELNLTPDQEAQIKTIMHGEFASHHGDMKGGFERGQTILSAFKGDTFVMDQVAPALDVRAKVTEMSGRFIDIAAQVLPILTPEQRTTAVQKLRTRAAVTAPEADENAEAPLL